MQNEDDFGFRGCDGGELRVNVGEKRKKDGDFVRWGKKGGSNSMRFWGLVGGAGGG